MAQRRAERLDIGRKSRFTPLTRTAVHSGPPIRKKITAKYHILRSLDTQIHDVEFCDLVRLGLVQRRCENLKLGRRRWSSLLAIKAPCKSLALLVFPEL